MEARGTRRWNARFRIHPISNDYAPDPAHAVVDRVELEDALERVQASGALDDARELARDFAAQARAALDGEPDRDTLEALTHAVVDRAELEDAFARLTQEQRAVVVLHHHHGYPLTEIAGILGIPVGTARSRLFYAVRQLRTVLDADSVSVTPGERSA